MNLDRQASFDSARVVDELCDRFEQALQQGEQPDLTAWLGQAENFVEQALPELVILELEYRLSRGEQVTAREYLGRFPALESCPTAVSRLVAAEQRAVQKSVSSFSSAALAAARLMAAEHRASAPRDPIDRVDNPLVLDSWLPEEQAGPIREASVVPATQLGMASTTSKANSTKTASEVEAFLAAVLTPSDRPDELGRFGAYRVLELLGMGGMGVVLRAEEEPLRRQVALKLMWPHVAARPQASERFLREARAIACIEHPRVVGIHRVDEFNGTPFLVMPLLRGQSLSQRLQGEPLPLLQALRIARQAAEGLAAVHAHGLIHRDIKPANLWLEQTPGGEQVRLLDFGLVRTAEEPITTVGQVLGTPAYMGPEQAAALPVTYQTDLFGLGAILYEMVTGVRPFQRPTLMATLAAVASHQPTPPHEINPLVSEALSACILHLLEKEPTKRPGSAEEVVARLATFEAEFHQTPDTLPQQNPASRQVVPRRYSLAMPALVTALVLALVGLGSWWLRGGSGRDVEAQPFLRADLETGKPLRLEALEILVFPRIDALRAGPPFKLGEGGVSATLGDQVTLKAKLNQPAYAYLIAFRPDGVAELCFPEKEDQPPPLTDQPRYPYSSNQRDERYGLREGTGLWVFAAVASQKPLPAYRDWLSGQQPPWRGGAPAPGNTLWIDDGQWVEAVGPGGMARSDRSKEEKVPGLSAVIGLTNWLKQRAQTEVARAVGFTVEPEK